MTTTIQIEEMAIPCPRCGADNDNESIYCGTCGAPLRLSGAPLPPPDLTTQKSITVSRAPRAQIPKRTRNIVIVADAVILILVVVAVAIVSARTVGPVITQSQTLNIVNGSFAVDKSGYTYYTIGVPGGTTDDEVKGSFSTTAVSGIQVYIMNGENLFVWAINPATVHVSSYFKSGPVVSDSINVKLSPGTYYLIFDNTFSNYSKVVQANFSLYYNP